MNKKIKVLVIDDSPIVRKVLTELLNETDDIVVIGEAEDPIVARDKIKQLSPDVLTLDIEMPKMDGITFLENIMRLRPMPVVMVSTLTSKGADATLRALELGAVDFLAKPKVDVQTALKRYQAEICNKVRVAASAKVRGSLAVNNKSLPLKSSTKRKNYKQIIAIGSSTGGTEALKGILPLLPADSPPIVITQHIPKSFSGPFAKRLDGICEIKVVEATQGMVIEAGHAYIAPGDQHLLISRVGRKFMGMLNDGLEVNRHKPSVDVMFRTVLESSPNDIIAVMLTGMGNDGAEAMLEIHQAGNTTIAQDENSSVVWGMPGSAVALSAVKTVLPLKKIAQHIVDLYE